MSVAAALVLRDRTNADAHQVLSAALDELVADGTWLIGHAWRRLRRVPTLAPAAATPPAGLHEPLRGADRLLRRIAAELDTPFSVADAASWVARRDLRAAEEVVQATVKDLVARGLLERRQILRPTAAGEALLAADPPPPAVRPAARDPRARAAGLRALSPLGAAFVTAWLAAPTGSYKDHENLNNPTGSGSTGWATPPGGGF